MADHIRRPTLLCVLTFALAAPALAGDVSVRLDAGAGFSVKDSTGSVERLRVDEATGNVSRNGALFVHTAGFSNTFVGIGAGNASGTDYGGNSGFGVSVLRSNTGYFNSAFGYGALTTNTFAGNNSAFGSQALRVNTTGDNNSGFGSFALAANTTGFWNTAVGPYALYSNTTGNFNSALGNHALLQNTSGHFGSAVGYGALRENTTGSYNAAFGYGALHGNITGDRNVAVGSMAGFDLTTGSDNIYLANTGAAAESGRIRIGTEGVHTQTKIAGIRGVTTGVANAIPVLIDSAGQLGTVSSSRSVKKDIQDMGDTTARLLELRPVTFRYREQEQTLPSGAAAPPEYGLIAEEVAEVFPDLVVYDEAGLPFTVKYHVLAPMLLNELKKQQQTIGVLTTRLAQLEERTSEAPR